MEKQHSLRNQAEYFLGNPFSLVLQGTIFSRDHVEEMRKYYVSDTLRTRLLSMGTNAAISLLWGIVLVCYIVQFSPVIYTGDVVSTIGLSVVVFALVVGTLTALLLKFVIHPLAMFVLLSTGTVKVRHENI